MPRYLLPPLRIRGAYNLHLVTYPTVGCQEVCSIIVVASVVVQFQLHGCVHPSFRLTSSLGCIQSSRNGASGSSFQYFGEQEVCRLKFAPFRRLPNLSTDEADVVQALCPSPRRFEFATRHFLSDPRIESKRLGRGHVASFGSLLRARCAFAPLRDCGLKFRDHFSAE